MRHTTKVCRPVLLLLSFVMVLSMLPIGQFTVRAIEDQAFPKAAPTITLAHHQMTTDEQSMAVHTHRYDDTWTHNDSNHWHECADESCPSATDSQKDIAPHAWNAGVTTVPTIHASFGIRTYTCIECGATYEETVPIIPVGGEWTEWMYDHAHPDSHYKYCTICFEHVYEPHKWDEGTVTQPASHGVPGIMTYTCVTCGVLREEEIPAAPNECVWSAYRYALNDPDHHYMYCTVCFDRVMEGHTWDDGALHASGDHYIYHCTKCSATQEDMTATIDDINVSMTGDLLLNVRVTLGSGCHDAQMKFVLHETEETVDGCFISQDLKTKRSVYQFTFAGVTPQCVGDEVVASVVHNGKTLATVSYSVKDYIEKLKSMTPDDLGPSLGPSLGLSQNQYDKLIRLSDDLLLYAGAAQLYRNHNTDKLVSTGISGTSYIPVDSTDLAIVNNGENVSFVSASLFFGSKHKLRFTFAVTDANLDDLVLMCSVNGGEESQVSFIENGDGTYSFETDAIAATDFDNVYTLTAYVNGVAGAGVSYSVRSYVYAKQNQYLSDGVTLTPMAVLARATYTYGRSVKAFLEAHE